MPKVSSACAGMNACISVGKLSEAKQLLQDMKDQSIPLDSRVYNILLKGLSRKGNINAIPGVLQEMQDANIKPSSVTYNTLINSYVEDAQLVEARRVCESAQDAGKQVGPLLVHIRLKCCTANEHVQLHPWQHTCSAYPSHCCTNSACQAGGCATTFCNTLSKSFAGKHTTPACEDNYCGGQTVHKEKHRLFCP